MQRYFQSAYPSRYVLIFLLAVLFWVPSFLVDSMASADGPLFYKILIWVFQENYLLQTIFAFTIGIASTLLINQVSSESGISVKISTTTALLFVMVAFALTFSTSMSPYIWVIFCLILMMRILFRIPLSANQPVLLFNAGFIAGIASLLAPESILFILIIWMSLLTHRTNHWRNYVSSILGIALPWIFLSSWYFWIDRLSDITGIWTAFLTVDRYKDVVFSPDLNLILYATVLLAAFLVSVRSVARLREKSINLRHNLAIVNYLLIISFAAFIVSANAHSAMLLVVPTVLIFTSYLGNVKHHRIYDIATIVYILLVLVNQYSRIFYSIVQ